MKIKKRFYIYFFVLILIIITWNAKSQEISNKYTSAYLVNLIEFANYNNDWYKINYPKYAFATCIDDSILINHYLFDDLLIIKKPKDFFKPIVLKNNTVLLLYVKDYLNNSNLNIKVGVYNNKNKKINRNLFIAKINIDNFLLNKGFVPGKRHEYPSYKILLVSLHKNSINCIVGKNKQFEKIILNNNYNDMVLFINNLIKK